jgi:hypothetical protein
MKILLRLRHWQIILMTLSPVILLSLLVINPNNIPEGLNLVFTFWCTMLLFIVALGSYIYTLGVNLHQKLPSNTSMSLKKFKICFAAPILYIMLITFMIVHGNSFFINFWVHAITVVVMSILNMYCMFYTLYFVAKALVTVEKQAQVTFSSFAIEFFALWYFIVGIWVIQPRVNKIFLATDS